MEEENKINEENKNNNESEEEKKKRIFIVRLIFFILFCAVLPFLFIVLRLKIFNKVTSVNIGFWGIMACLVVAIFAVVMLRYLSKALTEKSPYVSSLINGTLKVIIPLAAILWCVYSMRNSTELMIEVLGVVLASETCGILVNPLPEFIAEKKKQQKLKEDEDLADYIINKIKGKDSEDK